MRKTLSTFISVYVLSGFLLVISGCGGAPFNTEARKETLAAAIADAEDKYNRGDYDGAINIYNEIIADDPTNDIARTRLVFAYNTKAKLGVFDLMSGFASASSGDGNSTDQLTDFLKVVGLSETEKAEALEQIGLNAIQLTTMAQIREISKKAATLHQSWSVLCSYLPKDLLTAIAGTNGALDEVFGISDPKKCNGGVAGGKPSSAIAIAGLFILMSETAILFQLVMDKDADGQIDSIASLNTTTDLLKNAGSVSTAPATEAEAVTTAGSVATLLNSLSDFSDTLSGQLFEVLFADIAAMRDLATIAPGIPPEVVQNIRNSAARFREQQDKVQSVLKGSISNTDGMPPDRKLLAQAGRKSSRGIDVLGQGLKLIGKTDTEIGTILGATCTALNRFTVSFGFEIQIKKAKRCG